VPQPSRDDAQIDTLAQGKGSVGMAQAMQRDAGQSSGSQMPVEGLACSTRIERLPLLGGEDVAALTPVLAGGRG